MSYEKKTVNVSESDKTRINRLIEESIAPSQELNLIFKQLLGDALAGGNPTGDPKQMIIYEIIGEYPRRTVVFTNGDVVCYDDEEGTCSAGAC